ncbi:MAG: hypothetical protein GX031_07560 [Candidatus Riflebacteria bacterium]|nr:hypothetical protein [Candidatus Riflebacteria bacterium]
MLKRLCTPVFFGFFILLTFFFFTNRLNAYSLPITVIEGGVPLGVPSQMIEEGMRLGNIEMLRRAWEHYKKSAILDNKTNHAYLELGRIYFYLSLLGESTEHDFAFAEQQARDAIAKNPEDSDAHRSLGLILAGRGAFLDAYEELTLALSLNPTNEFLICDLATLHLALHEPRKTISYLEGYNHKSGWAYVVLAMAWSQREQKGKAILNLLKAKKLGYSGYWIDTMLRQFSDELGLPLTEN